jgi:hypothetical protein
MDSNNIKGPSGDSIQQEGGRERPPYTGEVIPSNPSDRMAPISDNRTQANHSENGGPTLVQPTPVSVSPVEVWVHRSWIVMYVVFCIWIGVVIAALPWTRVWTDNSIVMSYPGLRSILQLNFVRGIVTGLGLLDLYLGVWEAVHYRELKG